MAMDRAFAKARRETGRKGRQDDADPIRRIGRPERAEPLTARPLAVIDLDRITTDRQRDCTVMAPRLRHAFNDKHLSLAGISRKFFQP
jgi:hypothetical protein